MKEIKSKKCPHCGKPAAWENNPFRPFCSQRCRIIDLGNWASEKYRVPLSQSGGETIEEADLDRGENGEKS